MRGGRKFEEHQGLLRLGQTSIEFLRSAGDHFVCGWLNNHWSIAVVGNTVMGGYSVNYINLLFRTGQ